MHEDLDIDKVEKFLKRLDVYQKNLDKVEPWTNDAILKDLDESIEKYAKTNYKHFHSFKHHRKWRKRILDEKADNIKIIPY